MSIAELGPGHIGWQTPAGVVASVRVQRDRGDVTIVGLEYDTVDAAQCLLEAMAQVATAPRMVGSLGILEQCGFAWDNERWVRELTVAAGAEAETRAFTLAALEAAIRAGWGLDTTDEPENWTAGNPAVGQCAVTSRVVRDYLGGEILVAGVVREGRRVNRHAWNRLPSGLTLDLTREQFQHGEQLEAPSVPERLLDRNPERYELLAERVRANLG